jgi:2-C-methyl-D-erythritol 4-phosphate cytidylyltransferase/2-C-methyl-D-erythritol 2,4-cyclodiphosphate synthase
VAAIRERLSKLLGIEPGAVGLKATTTDGMGFTGRGEGIAVQAVVTVTT